MSDTKLRNFHEAQWDEDLIFEQSVPGSRSLLVPDVSKEAGAVTGALSGLMPAGLKRKEKPALPELAQPYTYIYFCACPRRPSARISTSTSAWAPVP